MDNITAIIPFWNGHATIWKLLDSLPPDLPVIIVDDQSDQLLHVEERHNIKVIRTTERDYFSGAANVGLAACQTDVLILNQDVWLEGTAWLDMLVEKRGKFALIGDRAAKHPAWPNRYVQGTFMFMRRDAIEKVGPLNAKDYPLWGSTCEWQLRAIRQDFGVKLLTDTSGWLHHEGRTDYKGHALGSAITEALRREPEKRGRFLWTPPAISVIIPCYNYGHYLTDCVNSLLGGPTCLGNMPGQTFQSFEAIIIDDASTDGKTAEIGQRLANDWKGIHYMRLPRNLGTPGAINAGIEATHAQVIFILSADDMLEPWALEKHYRALEAKPHAVHYGHMTLFANGQRGKPYRLAPYDFEALLNKNMMPACIMYQKRAWREIGGYPTEMVHGREDWAMNIRLGIHGWCGSHIGEGGYLLRREGHNRALRTATAEYWHLFRRQLKQLFPRIYEGDRPMGCCGKGSTQSARKGRPANPSGAKIAMVEGMIEVRYIGGNAGDMNWSGAVSRRTYVFGGVTRRGYVDPRDLATGRSSAPGLLELTEGRNKVFELIPEKTKTEPKTETLPEQKAVRIRGRSKLEIAETEPVEMKLESIDLPSDEPIESPLAEDAESLRPIDLLCALDGVGDKYLDRLYEAGWTVELLAQANPEDIKGVSLKRAIRIVEAARAAIA